MKLPALIQKELDQRDIPHKIERGSRHMKIFIGGALCGIIPMNGRSTSRRAELNVRAQIRKQIASIKNAIDNK